MLWDCCGGEALVGLWSVRAWGIPVFFISLPFSGVDPWALCLFAYFFCGGSVLSWCWGPKQGVHVN